MRFYCSPGGRFLYQADEILRLGVSPLLCEAVKLLYSGHSEAETKNKLSPGFSSEEIERILFRLKANNQKFKKDVSGRNFDNNELVKRLEIIFSEKSFLDEISLVFLSGWVKDCNLPVQNSKPICPILLWPDRIQIGPILQSSRALKGFSDFMFPPFVLDVAKEELHLPLKINYFSESHLQSIVDFVAAEILDSFDKSKQKTLREGLKYFDFAENKILFFENKWNFHKSRTTKFLESDYHAERLPAELSDKIIHKDGGYRASDPERTLQALVPFIEGPLGIAKIIRENFSEEKSSFNTFYAATRAFVSDTGPVSAQIECSAHGKGQTKTHARLSCYAELIERHQMGIMDPMPVLKAGYADIKDKVLTEESHDARYWLPAFCMVTEETFWLPFSDCIKKGLCEETKEFEDAGYHVSSNGFAGGATKTEAFIQGSFELVERDHAAIWWYNKLVLPEIELSSFGNVYFADTVEALNKQGKKLTALDLTMDLGIHVVAIVLETDGAISSIGLGAHLDIEIALSRALSECLQLLAAPGKLKNCLQKVNALPEEEKQYLTSSSGKKNKSHFQPYNPAGMNAVLLKIVENFKKNKLNLLYQNYSLPEMNEFYVVRAVAPGLARLTQSGGSGRIARFSRPLNNIIFEI